MAAMIPREVGYQTAGNGISCFCNAYTAKVDSQNIECGV